MIGTPAVRIRSRSIASGGTSAVLWQTGRRAVRRVVWRLQGGHYLESTFKLVIFEATGAYSRFEGRHNHMVDRLHQLANGEFDEFCFCNISTYQFP